MQFYSEIKDVPDKFVHVGGEVSFACWRSTESTKFMKAHPNITTYAELESYYEVQLLEILKNKYFVYYLARDI